MLIVKGNDMTANVGTIDRAVRVLLGLALIVAPLINLFGIWSSQLWGYGAMVVGAILVLTAVFKICPIYRVLGISTCQADA